MRKLENKSENLNINGWRIVLIIYECKFLEVGYGNVAASIHSNTRLESKEEG